MIIHVRNDDYDITRQLRSIILRTNILLRTFSKCSIEDKLHLFQSYCTNLNCSHLWHIYTKTQLNKLRITYNISQPTSSIRRQCYVYIQPYCHRWMEFVGSIILCTGLYQILSCTDNSILLCFMSSTNMLTSSIWRRWYLCLTKMLIYCVCFTMLYLYIVFYYGLWPENKVLLLLLLLLFVSDANSTHIYWPLWNGLEATDAEIDTAAEKGIHYTCVGPTSYAWSAK